MCINLPALRLETCFHIGSLSLQQRGERGESLEGHLLSVSTCPRAWQAVARLGGLPLHKLSHDGGALFLDLLTTSKDAPLRTQIEQWAIAQGLAEHKTLWKAWNYDSETEEWHFGLYDSKSLAANEISVEDEAGPDGTGCLQEVQVLVGTPTLGALVQIKDLATTDSFDYAAMVWTQSTQPQFDGVWWLENFDPDTLSAPRGGIFPNKLADFIVAKCDWSQAPEEEEGGDAIEETFIELQADTSGPDSDTALLDRPEHRTREGTA